MFHTRYNRNTCVRNGNAKERTKERKKKKRVGESRLDVVSRNEEEKMGIDVSYSCVLFFFVPRLPRAGIDGLDLTCDGLLESS